MTTTNLCHLLNPKESNGHILYFKETPRRLSSGSACETCRRRKTKCDGGQPCAFCKSNGIQCLRRASNSNNKRRNSSKAGKSLIHSKNSKRTYNTKIYNIETASQSSSDSNSSYSSHVDPFSWINHCDYTESVRSQTMLDKTFKIPSMLGNYYNDYICIYTKVLEKEFVRLNLVHFTDQLSCHTFTMKNAYGKQHFLKALE